MQCVDPRATNAYEYEFGSGAGTISVPAGTKLNQITMIAATGGGTLAFAGGGAFPVPQPNPFTEAPASNNEILGPFDVTFTNALSIFVSWVF